MALRRREKLRVVRDARNAGFRLSVSRPGEQGRGKEEATDDLFQRLAAPSRINGTSCLITNVKTVVRHWLVFWLWFCWVNHDRDAQCVRMLSIVERVEEKSKQRRLPFVPAPSSIVSESSRAGTNGFMKSAEYVFPPVAYFCMPFLKHL